MSIMRFALGIKAVGYSPLPVLIRSWYPVLTLYDCILCVFTKLGYNLKIKQHTRYESCAPYDHETEVSILVGKKVLSKH